MNAETTRRDQARDPLDDFLAGHPVEWTEVRATASELIDLCDARDITPIVYHRLRQQACSALRPAEARLESAARAAAARELVRRREIAEVLRALHAGGTRPILIKGVALAYTVYDLPSLRPYADVDALVRRDAVESIQRTMGALGYREAVSSGGPLLFGQFQMVKRDQYGIDHAFDFHWKISTQTMFADTLSYDEVDLASEAIPTLGSWARGASSIHALLVACIHPVMHHRNARRTIWAYDVHLLVSRLTSLDLERFADLAIDRRVAAICRRQLALAVERFGTNIPDRVFAKLQSQGAPEPSAGYLSPARRWRHELADNVRAHQRWIDRLRVLREVLFPPPRFIVARYSSFGRSGYVLLPALYIHRGLAGGWKVLTGRK